MKGPQITADALRSQVDEGLRMEEMTSTEGWKIFEKEMEKKISELRTMSSYPDNLRKIQASYQASNSLKEALGMVYSVIEAKNQAQRLLQEMPRS